MKASSAPPDWEVEPNDQPQAATVVGFGYAVHGTLAWARDEDVVCAEQQDTRQFVRWVVRDAESKVRERGAVLEETPLSGLDAFMSIRVHGPHAGAGQLGAEDAVSPWRSKPIETGGTAQRACLRLRLASDPWAGPDAPAYPPSGGEPWQVGIEKAE